ncbi:MAG TPA: malic enzyme-like NAD(P)-binding protein, partial [Paenibacillus sp.]|nr:malic enzyme-like NAD(P)-binding protein [Paenibacillus sp.]
GINLEDIASPHCFEIEKKLDELLDIPVFHDDQHGTAIVVLAGLLNALRCVGKELDRVKVIVCGVGAAGVACTNLLLEAGVKHIVGVDVGGSLHRSVRYESEVWNEYARRTNPNNEIGALSDVIRGADVFIGLSRPGVLTERDIGNMASDPVVFAMANPDPEIEPAVGGRLAKVFATGRSDYPNQLNNVLAFPGVFRAALDCRARTINTPMKIAAGYAIASVVSSDELSPQYIIPGVFNERVVQAVKKAVVTEAIRSGVARKTPHEFKSRGEKR